MKVENLIIKNVGKIAHEKIDLNMPLILFYGGIRMGKTTILNAVRWLCGAPTPADIIRHGQTEATIELRFHGGSISRRWYIGNDGTTKADAVIFLRDGKRVPQPAAEIRKLMNPFMLNQDHLREMGEADRKKFFAELFAIDTRELDIESVNVEASARDLRSKIKGYGDIDLTPVKPIDATALRMQLQEIRDAHTEEVNAVNARNRAISTNNATFNRGTEKVRTITADIADLEAKLAAAKAERAKIQGWLDNHQIDEEETIPAPPDTSDIEAKISQSAAQDVRVEQYQKNLKRDSQRREDIDALSGYESRLREIKADKLAKLKGVSDTSGIAGLEFDEFGNFAFEGTSAGMLSTSQIMRLSSSLSAMYPDGFGLELLDRGESLGKSIFEYVDRAKAEGKTILATIVGERPAKAPPEVGVFVVDDGRILA